MPGASMRNSARGKGHEEGGLVYAKVGLSLRSPPGYSRASTPQTRVCLLYCFVLSPLTLWGAVPHHHLSLWKRVNLQFQLIQFLGIIGVFKSKPLRWLSNLPDRFTQTPTAMHTIVYSLPTLKGTGSLRYSNSLEPLRELEAVRIKLIEDFIDEPMFDAKFPHPLYCILECVLINIVGM